MTGTDGSTFRGDSPQEVLQVAARSVAEGASLASVAAWFNVAESDLQEWVARSADQAHSNGVAASRTSDPIDQVVPLAAVKTETAPRRPAVTTRHPSPDRPPVHSPEPSVASRRQASPPPAVAVRGSLRVLRRRVAVVVAGVVLGACAGWVTAPGETQRAATFQATHTVIYEAQAGRSSYNIDQVALLATSGEVPSRVAARLNMDRGQVRSAVSAVATAEVGTIAISAKGTSPDRAQSLADLTAEELGAEIIGRAKAELDADLGRLRGQVDSARARLNAVPARNAAERASAQADLSAAERALEQFEATNAVKPQLRTLEEASARAVSAPGVQAPNSKPVRAGLLGGLGLLAGLGAVFALDRLDGKIRSKATAEAAFGVPVVAAVPLAPKDTAGQLLARTQPSSPVVEAYRALRTYVALWAPDGQEDDGHRVIVVTSPSAGEGKTTTVANLAAMLAEIGRSVVVVSADLRRPRIHELFDRAAGPGLVDLLSAAPGSPTFEDLDLRTSVRGVRLLPSGPAIENPAPLLEHLGELIAAARKMADFVLLDSPPLLVANDAADLARYADGVLLVAHAGKTPIDAAEHSAEILQRLEIPVVGAVLVASEEASSASRYYGSRYYAAPRSDA